MRGYAYDQAKWSDTREGRHRQNLYMIIFGKI